MKTFYSPTLKYTHICRVLEWFSIIKPLITQLFSKIMFGVIFQRDQSWQVANAELSPHPFSQLREKPLHALLPSEVREQWHQGHSWVERYSRSPVRFHPEVRPEDKPKPGN